MLAFIPVMIIGGFLGGCAVVIAASCVQIIKSASKTKSYRSKTAKVVRPVIGA